jgi:hypothetical protein
MTPRGVHLADATWMCAPAAGGGFPDHGNARRVFDVLSNGIMPPDEQWSQDWLDTYQAWMDGGFQPGSALGAAVAVTYEGDIRPKFRPQDIACMKPRGVHLADVTWMCNAAAGSGFPDHGHARRVFGALNGGGMPPDGQWSQEWLDTYQAWMNGGFQPGPAVSGTGGTASGSTNPTADKS